MSSYHNILVLIGLLLSTGSGSVMASDDNPWSMEEAGGKSHFYYDLNGGQSGLQQGSRPKESSMPKSSFNGDRKWQAAPGKKHRELYYGYAGPQSQGHYDDRVVKSGKFGAFPSQDGVDKKFGSTTGAGRGVQFGGKVFGAFPPLESGSVDDRRRRQWEAQRRRQKSSAFANIAPPPIPEPAPQAVPGRLYPYPYSGYGVPRGYGTEFAPPMGGLGSGYGLMPVNPGIMTPGLMW